jgi:lipopolysaccharide assembly protein A
MPDLHRPWDTATVSPPATGLHRLSQRKRTPTGIAWAALCIGLLAMAALIAFVVQNSHSVQGSFLWMRGSPPLASALLSAVAGTALVTAVVGVARGRQLRQRSRRG